MKSYKSNLMIITAVLCLLCAAAGCGEKPQFPFPAYRAPTAQTAGTDLPNEPEQIPPDTKTADTTAAMQTEITEATEKFPQTHVPEVPTGVSVPDEGVDFAALQKINPDIYAWVEIPGTAISYPVLQRADDNSYYVRRNLYGKKDAAGTVFTENYNSRDFTDRNTVIYGHYMKNGTFFTGLHLFIDADFFAENRYVYIYTPEKTLTYKIFAAYPYDTRHLLLSFDYSDPYVFGKVFESVFAVRDMSAQIAGDVTLDRENDRVLTLSTCFYGDEKRRFLLQAVLVTNCA